MAVELTISWEGRDAADFARILRTAANIDDFRPLFKKISKDVVIPSLEKHFQKGGDEPKWKELAPSTIARKSAAGVSDPGKILVHTGALERAATSQNMTRMSRNELRMSPVGIPYYQYHQKGAEKLPQRVIMRLAAADRTDINTAFANFVRGFMNFNPATGGRKFLGGGIGGS